MNYHTRAAYEDMKIMVAEQCSDADNADLYIIGIASVYKTGLALRVERHGNVRRVLFTFAQIKAKIASDLKLKSAHVMELLK